MARYRDPVCGKELDREEAVSTARIGDQEFLFCSERCRATFDADPARFGAELEGEPPYTETRGFVAPKFGSAASGGLENEPPTRRRRTDQ